jgi:ABC-2 type transport system permease protein
VTTAALERAERPEPWRGFAWLALRECHRVVRVWTQTMLAPVVSSLLFIIVFGLSLGGRISEIHGVPYEIYIVPGLIAMAMAQAVYSNNSSTLFQARSDRYIDDVLAAPMYPWQMNLGFNVGGYFRALVIGIALVALAAPLTGAPIERPLVLLAAVALVLVGFGALGTIVGVYAHTWDHISFVNNIVILPLTFLGGVFYSVDNLGSPWEQISHLNPLFYVVSAIRYGFLGSADVDPWISLAVITAIAAALFAWSEYLFRSGRRLKP